MQMNFLQPSAVSGALGNDQVEMKVQEVSLFKTKSQFKSMEMSAFDNPDGVLGKSVPPIISDEEAAASIDASTEQGG
jgi:hypothetical protein